MHKSNPEKCRRCSHTVLTPRRKSRLLSFGSGKKRERPKSSGPYYQCTKCRHIHDRKPFVCDECGASTIQATSVSPNHVISAEDLSSDPPPADWEPIEQPEAEQNPSIIPVILTILLMVLILIAFIVFIF